MSKWISADKQLPKKNELVLAIANGKPMSNITLVDEYELGEYTDEGWIIAAWPKWRNAKVTHWIPLPEAPKKPTNADRIRDMDDDELAQFLCDFRSCDTDTHPCNKCKATQFCRSGHMGMIDWLQNPAEEG